jgi:hypothetical protein
LVKEYSVENSIEGRWFMAIVLMVLGVMVRNSFEDMLHGSIVYLFRFLIVLSLSLNKNRAGTSF